MSQQTTRTLTPSLQVFACRGKEERLMYNTNQIAKQIIKLSKSSDNSNERIEEVITSYFDSFTSDLIPAIISIREDSYSESDRRLRTTELARISGISEYTLQKGCNK